MGRVGPRQSKRGCRSRDNLLVPGEKKRTVKPKPLSRKRDHQKKEGNRYGQTKLLGENKAYPNPV